MKKNKHTDWTDALRDALHDAEITPSEGGWERLLRDLDGGRVSPAETAASERSDAPERRQTPVPGSLREERDGQLVPGSLRDGRPVPASSLQPAGEGGKPRWRILGLRIAAAAAVVVIAIVGGELLWHPDPSAGTMPEQASVTPREDPGSGSQLRDEVAVASGWSQSPKSDVETSPEAGAAAENLATTLLAAADTKPEARRRLSADEPAASGDSDGAAADPSSAGASESEGAAVEEAVETRSAGHAERTEESESRNGQRTSEHRRAASQAAQRSSDNRYAWADPVSAGEDDAPRRRRASFSLFAAGGTASGGNLQTADLLASTPMGDASPSIVGNGDRFGPLMRDDYAESSFRHHLPLSFGLSVTAQFPYGLSLESGVTYTLLRSDVRRVYSSREISQKLHFIGVPLRLNWQFVERGRFAAYLAGGGMVEKCVSARLGGRSVDESDLQWSLMGALGAQYRLGDRVGLYFEPELSYYLTDTELRTSRSDAPLTLTLRIGVRLLF